MVILFGGPFRVNSPGHVAEHNRLAGLLPDGTVPATLDSSGLLPESQVPVRLTDASLSAAYVTQAQASGIPSAAAVTQGLYARTIPTPNVGNSIRPIIGAGGDPAAPGRVWAVGSAFGQIGYTDDHGGTYVAKSKPGTQAIQGAVIANGYMWVLTSANTAKSGQLWRSPAPAADGSGLSFTLIFDLAAPPSGLTTGDNAAFRNSCVAVSGANVYLVEYGVTTITGGPSIYYSADSGATWSKPKTWANGKHCHAVKVIGGVPWVMIGDGGFSDLGLWIATAANAGAWVQRSLYGEALGGNTHYGINMLPTTIEGQAMVLSEYDGNRAHGPLVFPSQAINVTKALLPQCTLPGAYVGTMRQMTLTSEGNLMWVTTGEGGSVGPLDSVWIARPPFTIPVLLEALPAAAATFGTMGDPVEDGDYVWFGTSRCHKELFVGQ